MEAIPVKKAIGMICSDGRKPGCLKYMLPLVQAAVDKHARDLKSGKKMVIWIDAKTGKTVSIKSTDFGENFSKFIEIQLPEISEKSRDRFIYMWEQYNPKTCYITYEFGCNFRIGTYPWKDVKFTHPTQRELMGTSIMQQINNMASTATVRETLGHFGKLNTKEIRTKVSRVVLAGIKNLINCGNVYVNCCSMCRCVHGDLNADGSKIVLKNCAKCKFRKYCSKKCQKESWVEHKHDCGQFNNTRQGLMNAVDTIINNYSKIE
jgi:hypothetical protein